MRAAAAGRNRDGVCAVVRFGIDDGPAGLRIDALGPSDLRERLAGDELAGDAVDHVEEAVLVGLHDDFALLAR